MVAKVLKMVAYSVDEMDNIQVARKVVNLVDESVSRSAELKVEPMEKQMAGNLAAMAVMTVGCWVGLMVQNVAVWKAVMRVGCWVGLMVQNVAVWKAVKLADCAVAWMVCETVVRMVAKVVKTVVN